LLGGCSQETIIEGFEKPEFNTWKTGWNHSLARLDLSLNSNPQYVSQGKASLRCALVTNTEMKDHYGGVKVPLSQSHFEFDVWLETPENVAIVWVYMYDQQGKLISGWNRELSKKPMKAGEKYTIQLSRGIDGSDFNYLGGTDGQAGWVDIFVLSQKQDVPIVFYVDNYRAH